MLLRGGHAGDRLRTGRTLYVYATPVPKGSYTDYLSTTLLDGAKAELGRPRKYAGGTIYAWCVTPSATFQGGCGADWVANEASVVFGMQVAGGEITAAEVSAALEHELPSHGRALRHRATGLVGPGDGLGRHRFDRHRRLVTGDLRNRRLTGPPPVAVAIEPNRPAGRSRNLPVDEQPAAPHQRRCAVPA